MTGTLLPKFGSYRLGRLASEEIKEWLLDEIDGGLAPSSVHRHYRTLHRVVEVAVKNMRIASNPCAGVLPPSVPRRRMVILDLPQVFDLADALPAGYRALIFLAVDAGMRWSELVGLRRSRVDVKACKVEVVEQLIRLSTGEWVWHPPKSEAGVRTIALSPFTARTLADHMEQSSVPGPDGLVFVNQAAGALITSSFHTHYFKPALASAGVRCRFHDLRHSSVALAIRAGAHTKKIQARVGHASITVTLDGYGHLFPSSMRRSPRLSTRR